MPGRYASGFLISMVNIKNLEQLNLTALSVYGAPGISAESGAIQTRFKECNYPFNTRAGA